MYTKRFVEVDNQKLHFYHMGDGPALVMFHASPSSSESLLPIADKLKEKYTVFCFDTPGYGQSDPLQEKPTSLTAYTALFHKAFQKLGIKKPAIYGTATGAQISVRYGIEHPESVSHIFLDNAAHFDDALAEKITEHYFPDLSPKIDGSHLAQTWTIVTQLFQYFPWCFTTEEYALNRPPIPDFVLQMMALDYLKAGATYDVAYRLAFQHERAAFVQQLKAPTSIFRWNNGILTKHVDHLLAHDFEDNIQAFRIDGDAKARTEQMVAHMGDMASGLLPADINTAVIEVSEQPKLTYVKPSENPPEVQSNGQHLNDAWNVLVAHNPSFDADAIQASLIAWYTEN